MKSRRSRLLAVGIASAALGAGAVPVAGLAGSITGSTGDGALVLDSGQEQVTYTAGANVASLPASTSPNQFYTRTGDTVHIDGVARVTPTSTGVNDNWTTVYIPLPIATGGTDVWTCIGTATAADGYGEVAARVVAGTGANAGKCMVAWHARVTAVQEVHYSLGYRVRD